VAHTFSSQVLAAGQTAAVNEQQLLPGIFSAVLAAAGLTTGQAVTDTVSAASPHIIWRVNMVVATLVINNCRQQTNAALAL
jgi:hypothetical protein